MEDKYIFETTNTREMDLVVHRRDMLFTLEEFKNWRRELNRSRAGDIKYLCEGKIYTEKEIIEDKDLPRDEHGFLKDCKGIYLVDDVISRIDNILSDLEDFLERNCY